MVAPAYEVVCPACDWAFDWEDQDNSHARPCPNCSYSFVWKAQQRWHSHSTDSQWLGMLERLPLPQLVEDELLRRQQTQPPGIPLEPPGRTSPPHQAPLHSPPAANAVTPPGSPPGLKTRVETTLPPRRSLELSRVQLLWIITAICLAGCVIIIAASLMNPSAANKTLTPDITADQPSTESGTTTKPKFASSFMSDARLLDLWNSASSSAVIVEYQQDGTTAAQSGTLVDSRGWIVTRRSSLATADSVTVHLAPSTWDTPPTRTVELRGVLAEHPTHDLVLLAVDPTPFPIVTFPNSSGDTSKDNNAIMLGYTSTDQTWSQDVIVADQTEQPLRLNRIDPLRSCSQVFDAKGDFLGIAVADSATQPAPILTRTTIATWLESIPGSVTPWDDIALSSSTNPRRDSDPNPADAATGVEVTRPADTADDSSTPQTSTPQDSTPTTPTESDPYQLTVIDELQELSASWPPGDHPITTLEDYQRAQRAAWLISKIDAIEDSADFEAGLRLMLTTAVEDFLKPWQKTPWPDDETLAKINQTALDSLQPDGGIWAYGKVVMQPGLAPEFRSKGTVILQLIGHDRFLVLPVSENFDQLPEGSRWLVTGITPGLTQVNFTSDKDRPRAGHLVQTRYLMAEPEQISRAR